MRLRYSPPSPPPYVPEPSKSAWSTWQLWALPCAKGPKSTWVLFG